MGDFIFDWNEGAMNVECPNSGIPIPRNQHTQSYLRTDFGSQNYMFDNDYSNPCRPPVVPPNSLTSNAYVSSDNQRSSLSPLNSMGSPFMISNSMDDIEIKMEPLEDFLDIGNGTNLGETHPPPLQEDNLLDNVNFEDLLMTDDMDSSTTTCLDPQHSSPAAMATVHPDEVLGLIRSDNESSHISHSFSSSINVPLKAENNTFGVMATSFPPQGIGWKDFAENQAVCTRLPFNSVGTFQPLPQRSHAKEYPEQNQSSRVVILQNEFVSDQSVNQERREDIILPFNNNETVFTELEPTSNSGASSALHELLTNSSQASDRSASQNLQSFSSHNINISPSPLKGILSNDIPIGQSVPGAASFLTAKPSYLTSRLSSSAPVNNFSFEQLWQRREPRQHLLSTSSLAEEAGGSTSSLSTGGGILSPMPHDLSIDEGIDSEEDSEADNYDSDSDNDSIMSEETISLSGSQNKKERHFWQYNVQAKGPKGHRVNITQSETDPHQLDKIMDPVFSPLCSIQGIKHSGKARRGDGNDLTPSPRKLVNIGIELNKLNKKINDMTPVSELPSTIRSKSRKEKNKLASRACRLKKKAQHEANKIKLHGLEQEHKSMICLINKAKDDLYKKLELATNVESSQFHSASVDSLENLSHLPQTENNETHLQMQQMLTKQIENAAKMRTKQRIAGYTTEFVNKVIENCKNGNSTVGLDELAQTFVKTTSLHESGLFNFNNEFYS